MFFMPRPPWINMGVSHGLKLLLDAHYEAKLDKIGGVSMVCVDVCV